MRDHEHAAALVEKLIARERWAEARRAIRALLEESPDDHWLLSRLALTHYEQHAYKRALGFDVRAVKAQPTCPLALWRLAGSLEMVGREKEASEVYLRLIRRGARRLATGRCGEGIRWATGLVADCWFRLGQIRARAGRSRAAMLAYQKHLALCSSGASIYTAGHVRRRMQGLDGNPATGS
jgi:tetratricopeptide (TPR) repeat protein